MLNEQLREQFAPVLSALRPPMAASASGSASSSRRHGGGTSSIGMELSAGGRIDHFRLRCLAIVDNLNTYKFGTRSAFKREIEKIEGLAGGNNTAAAALEVLLVQLEDDCKAQEGQSPDPVPSPLEGIPPIQRLADDRWLCTINVQGISTTIGEESTRELALQSYERLLVETRATKRALGGLYKLSAALREDQRVSDARMLREAAQLCHPRISAQRLQDSVSLNGPSMATTGKREAKDTISLSSEVSLITPRKSNGSRGSEKAVPVTPAHAVPSLSRSASSSSNCLSPSRLPTNTAGSLSSSPATSNSSWRNPKRKKPLQRLAFLRLRRLIQKRLCHHLEGQEVCVQARTDAADMEEYSAKISWTPTGRLEAGHVFSFRQGRRLTFADYVNDEIHRSISACPHMFLVSSRESIDDHLAVCDVFTDADRRKLGSDFIGSMQSYMKMKDKRSSNRL